MGLSEDVHLFDRGDLITDMDGARGVVAEVSALYAVIHWEDGREEEIDQGEPRIWVEGRGWEYAESYVDEVDTGLRNLVDRIEDQHQFWRTAGPKMPEPIHTPPETEGALLMPWWIVLGALVGLAYGAFTIFALLFVAWVIGSDWWREHQAKRVQLRGLIREVNGPRARRILALEDFYSRYPGQRP